MRVPRGMTITVHAADGRHVDVPAHALHDSVTLGEIVGQIETDTSRTGASDLAACRERLAQVLRGELDRVAADTRRAAATGRWFDPPEAVAVPVDVAADLARLLETERFAREA